MPIFLGLLRVAFGWLLRGLVAIIPNLVVKLFATFGLAWGTHRYVAAPLLSLIQGSMSGMPAFALECLGAMGADQAVTIMLSAYVVSVGSRLVLSRRAPA